MQKGVSSRGTSARSGGDALVPPASSFPPPLPPPPLPVTPPPSAAAAAGAKAGAPAKQPKSPEQQKAWAQGATSRARLHHIAMWRHRWLGHGWGETASPAARVKKIEKRRSMDEIMKQLLRHMSQSESTGAKQVPQRNHGKSNALIMQNRNRNGTASSPQRLRNSDHPTPCIHPLTRSDKLKNAISQPRNNKNFSRPPTQLIRIEISTPTQQKECRSSNAQPANQKPQHVCCKERASQTHLLRRRSNAVSTKLREGQCRFNLFHPRHDNRKSSALRRQHSSDSSVTTIRPRRQCRHKTSLSSVGTSRDVARSSYRREKSSWPGRKSTSTSVSPQQRCRKKTKMNQNQLRSDEKSRTVTQTGRLDNEPKTNGKQCNSGSVGPPSQILRGNHTEVTLSAPHLQCSHSSSILKRSRRGNCSDATESTELRSHSCSQAASDSRLQVCRSDRQSSEDKLRERYINIVSLPKKPNEFYFNKMPFFMGSVHRNAGNAQPWEYRTNSRFSSSWWRHQRPYLVSTTTQTCRRRRNPKRRNRLLRRRSDEAPMRTVPKRRRLEMSARTSHSKIRKLERSSKPVPSSRGGSATARTSQTHSQNHMWANIPASPRDHNSSALESHMRRRRRDSIHLLLQQDYSNDSDSSENQRNFVSSRRTDPQWFIQESVTEDECHGLNVISRATQTKSQRLARGSRSQRCRDAATLPRRSHDRRRCRDAAVMTTLPKLWRLDTGTAMKPLAMKEDASSTAEIPSAIDLSLSIFLQILRQPTVAAAAAVVAATGANGPGALAETQHLASVGAGDSASPAPPPCKLREE